MIDNEQTCKRSPVTHYLLTLQASVHTDDKFCEIVLLHPQPSINALKPEFNNDSVY